MVSDQAMLHLSGAGHSYDGKHWQFRALDLHLRAGEITAILGPNGRGKSTLLRVLAGLLKPTAGLVQAHPYTGFVPQDFSGSFPYSVLDVVLMGRYPYFDSIPQRSDLAAVEEVMKETGVWDLKEREYNSLSGGEKQRVHLARVMAQLKNEVAHKLVLLDEPLNNLDVKHQHQVLELMADFARRGNTVITVLHDLNLAARFATRVLMMKNGRVLAQGAPGKVLTAEVISEAYGFPCRIWIHPAHHHPVILFGN